MPNHKKNVTNRLLQYKDTPRLNLYINPDMFGVWNTIVQNKQSLGFTLKECKKGIKDILWNIQSTEALHERNHNKNFLYLALGFLHYTEYVFSGSVYKAPLVLIPVSLDYDATLPAN